jgi:uncharacterized protein (TIGR00369 family)
MNVFDTMPELSGLEQLRALLSSGRQPPIGTTLGFRLVSIEEGEAVFEGEPGPHAFNPLGTIHGGYAASLLDSACGCAAHSRLSAKQLYTTLELKVAYHRPMTAETGLVRATGTLLSIGRRAAFAEAKLTGQTGKLYASATSTLLIADR